MTSIFGGLPKIVKDGTHCFLTQTLYFKIIIDSHAILKDDTKKIPCTFYSISPKVTFTKL